MQELVVVTSCDIHFEAGQQVAGEEVIWFNEKTGEPWVVDLCKEDREKISIALMPSVVEQVGRPLDERRSTTLAVAGSTEPEDKGQRKKGNVDCPYPGCERGNYANRGSLAGHFKADHGKTLATWEAEQSGQKPELECKYEGCDDTFFTPQQRSAHMMQHHGWRKNAS